MPTMSPKKGSSNSPFTLTHVPALFTVNGFRVTAPVLIIAVMLLLIGVRLFNMPDYTDHDEVGHTALDNYPNICAARRESEHLG